MTNDPSQAASNRASWNSVIQLYEELSAHPNWQRVVPLLELEKDIMASQHGTRFRGGTSVDALIVSTAPHHGLQPGEPWIRVAYSGDHGIGQFEAGYWNGAGDVPLDQRICDAASLRQTVEDLMDRLWHDTRGTSVDSDAGTIL